MVQEAIPGVILGHTNMVRPTEAPEVCGQAGSRPRASADGMLGRAGAGGPS